MSRPSRGFTVAQQRPPSVPICPGTGTGIVQDTDQANATVEWHWSPDPPFSEFSLQVVVNGGAPQDIDSGDLASEPFTTSEDLSGFAIAGDDVYFIFSPSGAEFCPDISFRCPTFTVT
jgi:hypothetical protein